MKVLAGDIGGTKTLLQVVEYRAGVPVFGEVVRFSSRDFDRFEALLDSFLARQPKHVLQGIDAACFAVAGPVDSQNQTARVTNLPWTLESQSLARQLGDTVAVRLVNDFYAVGLGVSALNPTDLVSLQSGVRRPDAPALVVGAGTGLGVAQVLRLDSGLEVLPSEGGHLAFSPRSEEETALQAQLRDRFGRVSWERLVSGTGLVNIYRYFWQRNTRGNPDCPPLLSGAEDPGAAIAAAARAGRDPNASQAVALFVRLYGTVAGELALVTLPFGGVYLAGGIAPKLVDELRQGPFLAAFHDKGRMQPLTAAMPVDIVMDTEVGLKGAALAALR